MIRDKGGADAVESSVGYVGLIPSSYSINAIYQWTGGPEEFVLRVANDRESTVAVEGLEEPLRAALCEWLPDVRFSFPNNGEISGSVLIPSIPASEPPCLPGNAEKLKEQIMVWHDRPAAAERP
jgi:hypothetical protein